RRLQARAGYTSLFSSCSLRFWPRESSHCSRCERILKTLLPRWRINVAMRSERAVEEVDHRHREKKASNVEGASPRNRIHATRRVLGCTPMRNGSTTDE